MFIPMKRAAEDIKIWEDRAESLPADGAGALALAISEAVLLPFTSIFLKKVYAFRWPTDTYGWYARELALPGKG